MQNHSQTFGSKILQHKFLALLLSLLIGVCESWNKALLLSLALRIPILRTLLGYHQPTLQGLHLVLQILQNLHNIINQQLVILY